MEDVDLSGGVIHIHAKGGTRERVFLNPGLVRMLGGFPKENTRTGNGGPDIPLFRSQSGSDTADKRRLGARQVQLRFAALCRKAGVSRRVSVHSLRHTFATRLYHKTGDLYLVQRALGHRQITTTEIYARVNDTTLKRAIAGQ
ncbi:MAG: tyrosine-type recombinase/integrase [Acidobacteria bacterium]|nr:tyrosine-type recombinase/integrase [Acidobacteriota bacterium]